MRNAVLVAGSLCVLAGCPLDALHHYDRPAHGEVGLNTRHFAADPSAVAARTVSPPSNDTGIDGTATSVSFRFTMLTKYNTYTGVEAEAGTFSSRPGSNLAGGYGVFGVRAPGRLGSLGAELTGGWRGMRDSLQAPDQNYLVIEPRVRGELWLSSQITLGAAAGAEIGGQHAWLAGVYLGIHSHAYGRPRTY